MPDDPDKLARAIAAAAADHDLVLTTGGVSTGEADHVRARGRGGRPAGVLAGRHQARPAGGDGRHSRVEPQASAAFVGLPGNPAAVYVTFARVVRPLLLRLAGADADAAGRAAGARRVRLPQESRAPRIRAGQAPARRRRRRSRPSSTRRRAPACITSLTETDGLVELPEDATTVEPGATVGFLSYAALVG